MPLRRAVTKVQMLSDVDAWAEAMRRNKVSVQYLVRLDEPVRDRDHCSWPVEVRGDGTLWRPTLLPMYGEDCRFEGRLSVALAHQGPKAEALAADLLALTSGGPGAHGRLWSFDLLRMAISKLACGGSRERRGGFFPDGMSGSR